MRCPRYGKTNSGCCPREAYAEIAEVQRRGNAADTGGAVSVARRRPFETTPYRGRYKLARMNSSHKFTTLPCLDSPQRAAARRAELDISRNVAAWLGQSAIVAIESGKYADGDGNEVAWALAVQRARNNKRSIPPGEVLQQAPGEFHQETRVEVANETTLQASQRLIDRGLKPIALNFANGIYPGGGFLAGARAQEEVLCRSSALYATLFADEMYKAHARRPRQDSTDWAIYSPDVPVFRDDDGTPLKAPWTVSFISSAAPYAPAIGQPEAGDLLQRRISRVLEIARTFKYRALVLGAWGCGAFGNDPERTAQDFRRALNSEFRGVFTDVIFAITDWSPERRTLGPFRDAFAG